MTVKEMLALLDSLPRQLRPKFVYPHHMVEEARKFWGESVDIIDQNDTYLPASPEETDA